MAASAPSRATTTAAAKRRKRTGGNGGNDNRSTSAPLFAFDASVPSGMDANHAAINPNSGRPKRRPKAVLRFDQLRYPARATKTSATSAQPTTKRGKRATAGTAETTAGGPPRTPKTGHGFACPRCSAPCAYDARKCGGCGLECYYEAGVGAVVLKARREGRRDGAGREGGAANADECGNECGSDNDKDVKRGEGGNNDRRKRTGGHGARRVSRSPGEMASLAAGCASHQTNVELSDQLSDLQSKYDGVVAERDALHAEVASLREKLAGAHSTIAQLAGRGEEERYFLLFAYYEEARRRGEEAAGRSNDAEEEVRTESILETAHGVELESDQSARDGEEEMRHESARGVTAKGGDGERSDRTEAADNAERKRKRKVREALPRAELEHEMAKEPVEEATGTKRREQRERHGKGTGSRSEEGSASAGMKRRARREEEPRRRSKTGAERRKQSSLETMDNDVRNKHGSSQSYGEASQSTSEASVDAGGIHERTSKRAKSAPKALAPGKRDLLCRDERKIVRSDSCGTRASSSVRFDPNLDIFSDGEANGRERTKPSSSGSWSSRSSGVLRASKKSSRRKFDLFSSSVHTEESRKRVEKSSSRGSRGSSRDSSLTSAGRSRTSSSARSHRSSGKSNSSTGTRTSRPKFDLFGFYGKANKKPRDRVSSSRSVSSKSTSRSFSSKSSRRSILSDASNRQLSVSSLTSVSSRRRKKITRADVLMVVDFGDDNRGFL